MLFRFSRVPVLASVGLNALGVGAMVAFGSSAFSSAFGLVFGVVGLALQVFFGHWLVRTFAVRIRHAAAVGAETALASALFGLAATAWVLPDAVFPATSLPPGATRSLSLVIAVLLLPVSLAFSAGLYALGAWLAKRGRA